MSGRGGHFSAEEKGGEKGGGEGVGGKKGPRVRKKGGVRGKVGVVPPQKTEVKGKGEGGGGGKGSEFSV